ncbi:MAG: UDP-N-acetylglucosamine pyrophosphorylase [Deltaproteobacteria bacterium]|nr:UDP-N-acetylglucosamine pyrophosphorylase [Deltaproteobacteria bacterium]
MDLKPRCGERIAELIEKGVDIPNPLSLDVGEEVDLDRISAYKVRIYPGCRIYGKDTVISSGSQIGREGPVTIEGCQLGRDVELKGGFFSKSVFLDRSNMGLGAHVREGCILEEEAGGAHCVGLKQTILFPFVTLGSLINFCDCLMAGGTSRKDHSEVGSSYIHFNFPPDGDKATASLIGDVPRGVMLNQPAIFLGGQGGIVGPVRMGFGNVVAAGTVLREDCLADSRLIPGRSTSGKVKEYRSALYPNLIRVAENNIIYLANLAALSEWYVHVRKQFLDGQEFGPLIHAGLLDRLSSARKERLKRYEAFARRASAADPSGSEETRRLRKELGGTVDKIQALCEDKGVPDSPAAASRDTFLAAMERARQGGPGSYIETIQALPAEVSSAGTRWLRGVVEHFCAEASRAMPGLRLFGK